MRRHSTVEDLSPLQPFGADGDLDSRRRTWHDECGLIRSSARVQSGTAGPSGRPRARGRPFGEGNGAGPNGRVTIHARIREVTGEGFDVRHDVDGFGRAA